MPGFRIAARFVFFLTGFVILVSLGSCAGGKVAQVDLSTELPDELPEDLRDKFEVTGDAVGAKDPKGPTQPKTKPKVAKKKKRHKKKAPFKWPTRRPAFQPVWMHEKIVLDLTYLGMVAGTFTIEILPGKTVNERPVYHIFARALSSRFFSLFYRLDDTVESFWDFEGLFSHRFHLKLDETKQTRNSLELYDSEKKQTYYWNRWNRKNRGYHESKKFFPIDKRFPQDSLSSLYYVRSLPLKNGGKYSFPVVSEGKTWEAEVNVVGRERIKTPMGRKNAIKLKPVMKFKGVMKQKGDIFLWVTDDDRRFPLRLEAKVKIGRVVAVLKEAVPGQSPH